MADPLTTFMIAGKVLSFAGNIFEAKANKEERKRALRQARLETNLVLSDLRRRAHQDIVSTFEASAIRSGARRAATGAGGLALGYGTAISLQRQEDRYTLDDVMQIRRNLRSQSRNVQGRLIDYESRLRESRRADNRRLFAEAISTIAEVGSLSKTPKVTGSSNLGSSSPFTFRAGV